MKGGAKAESCSRSLRYCQTELQGKGWPSLVPQVMGKCTQHILDPMNPSIFTISLGRTQSQQIKSEIYGQAPLQNLIVVLFTC